MNETNLFYVYGKVKGFIDMEKKKRFSFFHIRSLKKGWLLSMMLLLVTLTIVLVYLLFGVLRESRRQAVESFSQLSEVSAKNLDALLSESQEAAQMAGYSTAIQKYLLSDTPGVVISASSAANDLLNAISVYGNGFTEIMLFSERGRKITINNLYTDLVQKAFESSGDGDVHFKSAFYSQELYYKGENYIVYFFPVYGIIDGYRYRYNPIYGAVVYRMNDLLANLIAENYKGGTSAFLDGKRIVGSSRTLTPEEVKVFREQEPGFRMVEIDGKQFWAGISIQKDTGWKSVYFAPVDSIQITYGSVGSRLLLLIAVAVVLAAALVLGILSMVRKDIGQLTGDIRAAGAGGGRVREPELLEIQPIARAFNLALDDLQASARREQEAAAAQYEAQLAQSHAEMLAYRSQINPHFLFNTLESVRSLAHRYGAGPVEQLVGGMSYMCRYSLYSRMIVKLEDELGHLGAYFSVMEVRFPGRYRIMEAIDPDTMLWPALSMMLQPIAENALLHAFTGRRSGIILVQSFVKEKRLHIRIADNGIGMDEETLEKVCEKISRAELETAHIDGISDHGPEYKISIGLPNINRRLKLAFGKEAGLSIRSKKGYYTAVEIVIPAGKESGYDRRFSLR